MISQLLSESKWKEPARRSHVDLMQISVLLFLWGGNYLIIVSFSHIICKSGGLNATLKITARTKAHVGNEANLSADGKDNEYKDWALSSLVLVSGRF